MAEKYSLYIHTLGKTLSMEENETVLDTLRRNGIEISAPCNGQGICGKCKIRLVDAPGAVDGAHDKLTLDEIREGIRLACRLPADGDMSIHLPIDYSLDARILEGETISGIELDPAATVSGEGGKWYLTYAGQPNAVLLEDWKEEYSPKGISVDIGTTSVVLTLMDLTTGKELATKSCLNPQTRFGHDVLSRIQMGSKPEGLNQLAQVLYDDLNMLIRKACEQSESDPLEIVDIVIGGNTTMLEIVAKINPESLGQVPFIVEMESGRSYDVSQFGIEVNPAARVYVPPISHAYVGSDISSGLLSTGFFNEKTPVLFIDIGTNGEMGFNSGSEHIVTSTAAGPAFEGMGISNGMRAAPGAIEMVQTNGKNLNVRIIGDGKARGICGSGIIDTMAGLLHLEVVDPGGRMKSGNSKDPVPQMMVDRMTTVDGIPAVSLADKVLFTQRDVRQLQLATSAIRTGIQMLLDKTGTALDDLDKVVIAGAFGYHLRKESLKAVGIIPAQFKGEVVFAGNTCRTGCAMLLLNQKNRTWLEKMMAGVSHLPIAEGMAFQDLFVKNLTFPSMQEVN